MQRGTQEHDLTRHYPDHKIGLDLKHDEQIDKMRTYITISLHEYSSRQVSVLAMSSTNYQCSQGDDRISKSKYWILVYWGIVSVHSVFTSGSHSFSVGIR